MNLVSHSHLVRSKCGCSKTGEFVRVAFPLGLSLVGAEKHQERGVRSVGVVVSDGALV
jgi:hypothetical protein